MLITKCKSNMLYGYYSPRGGGGGGTLIFLYVHRLRSFFGVQNFEFHYFGGGGGSDKMK